MVDRAKYVHQNSFNILFSLILRLGDRLFVVNHDGGLGDLGADLDVVTTGVAVGGDITGTVQASTISNPVSKRFIISMWRKKGTKKTHNWEVAL